MPDNVNFQISGNFILILKLAASTFVPNFGALTPKFNIWLTIIVVDIHLIGPLQCSNLSNF